MAQKTLVIIAHYGLDKKITQEQCESALVENEFDNKIFIDFEAGSAELGDLYDLPFENLALAQGRKYNDLVKPVLQKYPDAHIAYFGLTPIPIGFHFGYLVGNTFSYTIYQWHHQKQVWFAQIDPPSTDYRFEILPVILPNEIQKGSGEVTIRIGTSFKVDPQSTFDLVPKPANEFDIELRSPHLDSLYDQENIHKVVNTFQEVLDAYANKLSDRNQIHLFLASSSGLPFALGTRINPNIYPLIQTYQFSRDRAPKYKEAVLISKEVNERVVLREEDKEVANKIRHSWQEQLQDKLKPFIQTITGKKTDNWFQTICISDDEYNNASHLLKNPWIQLINIGGTSLKHDKIDVLVKNIDDGFEYIELTNTWLLDDGFLSGLQKRLEKNSNTDIMQAGRLFFFHEALHYSNLGHRLTREIANGIGQFPKVIEEADYQADVWALLTEYRYCQMYEPSKLKAGIKAFFCNTIDTAVETMWSFVDNGAELTSIQIRSMNRFLNWYWQWIQIENISGEGKLEDIIKILLEKPVIEFAGAPMVLIAHRTYYRLNFRQYSPIQLAAFIKNIVYRFASTNIEAIVDGFKMLNGEKIKTGLKGFQITVGQ